MTAGKWKVAASGVLPIRTTGGAGSVVANTDGTVIELHWTDVRTLENGKAISFDNCEWVIKNRIDRADGVSQNVGGRKISGPRRFTTDFDWLASCDLDIDAKSESDRRLVIRGRMLPESPELQPLDLEKLTAAASAD